MPLHQVYNLRRQWPDWLHISPEATPGMLLENVAGDFRFTPWFSRTTRWNFKKWSRAKFRPNHANFQRFSLVDSRGKSQSKSKNRWFSELRRSWAGNRLSNSSEFTLRACQWPQKTFPGRLGLYNPVNPWKIRISGIWCKVRDLACLEQPCTPL